jgi:hypothetical protein
MSEIIVLDHLCVCFVVKMENLVSPRLISYSKFLLLLFLALQPIVGLYFAAL